MAKGFVGIVVFSTIFLTPTEAQAQRALNPVGMLLVAELGHLVGGG